MRRSAFCGASAVSAILFVQLIVPSSAHSSDVLYVENAIATDDSDIWTAQIVLSNAEPLTSFTFEIRMPSTVCSGIVAGVCSGGPKSGSACKRGPPDSCGALVGGECVLFKQRGRAKIQPIQAGGSSACVNGTLIVVMRSPLGDVVIPPGNGPIVEWVIGFSGDVPAGRIPVDLRVIEAANGPNRTAVGVRDGYIEFR